MAQGSLSAQGQGQWKTVTVPKELDEVLGSLDKDGKVAAVGKYLHGHGWIAASTPWMLVEDAAWFKGDTLVIAGKAGMLAYRIQGRA